MKEFEKWDDSLPTFEKRYQSLERKKGWRAALEMVKREIFEHKEALDVIEEELEDEAS